MASSSWTTFTCSAGQARSKAARVDTLRVTADALVQPRIGRQAKAMNAAKRRIVQCSHGVPGPGKTAFRAIPRRSATLRRVKAKSDEIVDPPSDGAGIDYGALFESAPDAILIADDQGRYVAANAAACEIFGVPLQGLLGK